KVYAGRGKKQGAEAVGEFSKKRMLEGEIHQTTVQSPNNALLLHRSL
ncbi:unnamed protein product, partial [marine sediment metagenome]